jgi:hypothetical protein
MTNNHLHITLQDIALNGGGGGFIVGAVQDIRKLKVNIQ